MTVQSHHQASSPLERYSPAFPDRWLPAFRVFVAAVVILHLAVFMIAIPLDYQARLADTTLPDVPQRLADAGISAEFFAGYMTSVTVISGLTFTLLGILILVRRSRAFAPLFVAMVLVIEGTQISGLFYALDTLGVVGRWFADVTDAFSSTMLVLFFLIFPNGRFVPRWTRWFALGMVAFALLGLVFRVRDPLTDYPLLTLISLGVIFGVMVYAQVYRYRRGRDPVERQQIKWVVVGMCSALVLLTTAAVVTVLDSNREPLEIMFWYTVVCIGLMLIPLSIAIAILRYRLLDIDYLINRTLVYSSLMVIIGGIYTVSVMGLQVGLGVLAGSSGLTVALSTLISVALFRPIRSRVQAEVDRRFFRTRYDMSETLGRFSQSIRDEVDLERLEVMLSQTINDAVRPAQISVWMVASDAQHAGQRSLPGGAAGDRPH